MPRRNRRRRRPNPTRGCVEPTTTDVLNPDKLARSLVLRGLASARILDDPASVRHGHPSQREANR